MSDELALYKALKTKGLSLKAIAVCLGHGQEESGNECNRLQGDFAGDRRKSKEYTASVDNGTVTRNDFVFHGPNGGGYGWLQWTYWARKAGLWNVAKDNGWSVGSVEAAVEWFWNEMHQVEYSYVFTALQSDMSLREMSDIFMKRFERPADQSESACARRAALCQQMYNKYKDVDIEVPDTDVVKYWPPRGAKGGKSDPGLCEGMRGLDVEFLQTALRAHGYEVSDDAGVFGSSTKEALKKFQKDKGLVPDGICGPLSWAALLKY